MEINDYLSFISNTLAKVKSTITIVEMVVEELHKRTHYDQTPASFVNIAPQPPTIDSSQSHFIHGHQFVPNQATFQQHWQLQPQFHHQPQYHQPQQETQSPVILSEVQSNTVPLAVDIESTPFLNQSLENATAIIINDVVTFAATNDTIFREIISNIDEENAYVSSSSGVSSAPSTTSTDFVKTTTVREKVGDSELQKGSSSEMTSLSTVPEMTQNTREKSKKRASTVSDDSQPATEQQQKRVKGNPKPFKCDEPDCGYAGAREHHLKRHSTGHLTCLLCGFKCAGRKSYMEHEKVHQTL